MNSRMTLTSNGPVYFTSSRFGVKHIRVTELELVQSFQSTEAMVNNSRLVGIQRTASNSTVAFGTSLPMNTAVPLFIFGIHSNRTIFP